MFKRSDLATPEFNRLLLHAENRHVAIGWLAELRMLARHYYLPNKNPIPQFELEDARLPITILVEIGYLEKEPQGWFLKNSMDEFADWFLNHERELAAIKQRKDAARKSVQSKSHHKKRGNDGKFKKR